MKERDINAAVFFVFDQDGKLTDGGAAGFTRLEGQVEIKINIFKPSIARRMYETRPNGGYLIVDEFTGGRLKVLTCDMEDDIPYRAVTGLIDTLRRHFKIPPVVDGVEVRGVFMKPNPAKS